MTEKIDTLAGDLKKLYKELERIRTRHLSLSHIVSKLPTFSSTDYLSFNYVQLNDIENISFYESDQTLTINNPSFISNSIPDDILSDVFDDNCLDLSNLNLINCNCNEIISNYFFAEENVQYIIPEESLETPFFKLKHKHYVYNEEIHDKQDFMEIMQMLLLVYVIEICELFEGECSYIAAHFIPSMFCSPFFISFDNIANIYNFIIMVEQKPVGKILPRKINTTEEHIIKDDIGSVIEYCGDEYLTTNIGSKYLNKYYLTTEVVDKDYQSNNLYYTNNIFKETFLGYLKFYVFDNIAICSHFLSYSSSQQSIFSLDCLEIKNDLIIPKWFKQALQLIPLPYPYLILNNLDSISFQRLMNPPKIIYSNYLYKHYALNDSKKQRNTEYDSEKGHSETNGIFGLSKMSGDLKDKYVTSSERLWNLILRKTLAIIYRKIASEMFKIQTYTNTILSPEGNINVTNESQFMLNNVMKRNFEIIDMKEKYPSYIPTDKIATNYGGVIKLNSIDLLEQKLCNLNLKDPQIQQCKNIFDMKNAIKLNLLKDSDQTNANIENVHSYFSKDNIESLLKNTNEITESSNTVIDQITDSTIIQGDKTRNSNITFSETLQSGYEVDSCHECLQKNIRSFTKKHKINNKAIFKNYSKNKNRKGKNYSTCEENSTSNSKLTEKSDNDNSGIFSQRSNRPSVSGDQNRYFKTSRRSYTEQLMEEVHIRDENFNMKTLRQKAVACILNSKVLTNVPNKLVYKSSAHIDNFFDKHKMMLNKTYRCLECRTFFKLAAELRQHLRSHTCRKNILLSNS